MTDVPTAVIAAVADLPPVFVDPSGRRHRWLRRVAYAAGALGLAYTAMVGVSFAGGPVRPENIIPFLEATRRPRRTARAARPDRRAARRTPPGRLPPRYRPPPGGCAVRHAADPAVGTDGRDRQPGPTPPGAPRRRRTTSTPPATVPAHHRAADDRPAPEWRRSARPSRHRVDGNVRTAADPSTGRPRALRLTGRPAGPRRPVTAGPAGSRPRRAGPCWRSSSSWPACSSSGVHERRLRPRPPAQHDDGQGAVPDRVVSGGPIMNAASAGNPSYRLPARTIALTFDDGPDPRWTPRGAAGAGRPPGEGHLLRGRLAGRPAPRAGTE